MTAVFYASLAWPIASGERSSSQPARLALAGFCGPGFGSLEDLPKSLRVRIQVDPEPHPDLSTPCWHWIGRLNRGGYGRAWHRGSEPVAHRAVYEELVGRVPDRRVLDHLCRNRACVSPWHLEPVTHRENTARGDAQLYCRRC